MESLWIKNTKQPAFSSLNGEINTEVLIIGGGITGILTAYFLEQQNIPYILVEKNKICSGTTMNSTAKLTYQHRLIYQDLLKNQGIELAQMYLQANMKAFAEYEKLCKNIDCDFEYKDNYVYSRDNYKKLVDEISALEQIGYKTELRENLPLPFPVTGAVVFHRQAQFHPLKFLYNIAEKLNIYENTFVKKLKNNTATTDKGIIHANKIIIATHFPFINRYGSYYLKLNQNRSYTIALDNAQYVEGMYTDENKKGLSFRNYGNLLLLTGGSHRTGEKGGNWNELRTFAKIRYPHSREICYWASQDCISLDEIPYIGNYSANAHDIYVASGFNKWGFTGSMVSAMILSDMCAGIENPYKTVFNPSRSILKYQLLVNGLKSTKNLLTPTKPRCPHLGCALKWNRAERSWDCPCHGSRFEMNGDVIDNPSNYNLKL